MSVDSKIIEKISKLLALAESDNVNEAASAAARAQELMTKHQLAIADIQANGFDHIVDPIDDLPIDLDKSLIHWKTCLAAGIAKANGCATYNKYMYVNGKQAQVVTQYVGPRLSVDAVTYMYRYLVREINRLAALRRGDPGVDRKWLRDFRLGAVAEITTRLIKMAEHAKVGANGSALAVIDKKKEGVEEAIKSLNLKKGDVPQMNDQGAFDAGRSAATTINISSGLALEKGAEGALGS